MPTGRHGCTHCQCHVFFPRLVERERLKASEKMDRTHYAALVEDEQRERYDMDLVDVINRTALREGWVLSHSDEYGLSLERDDDDYRFDDDDAARSHVERWAAQGCREHKDALRLVRIYGKAV